MKRRKFLTWIASLPIVTTLLAKIKDRNRIDLRGVLKEPKTTTELIEVCRESLQRHLGDRFNGRCCEVVLYDTLGIDAALGEKPRLGFTSMIDNGSQLDKLLDNMAYGIYLLVEDGSRGSKESKIEVRLLSLDRVELVTTKNPISFPFDADAAEMVVKEDGGWLLLKWDLGPEGLLEWMRATDSAII